MKLSDRERRELLSNSIARVMSTTLDILREHPDYNTSDTIDALVQDWEALDGIVAKLWETAQENLRQEIWAKANPPLPPDMDNLFNSIMGTK